MNARFEVDKTEEGRNAHSRFFGNDLVIVEDILDRVEKASLMPEQRLIIQLTLLQRLDEMRQAAPLSESIDNVDTFTDEAIAEIGETVRRQRHIGSITGGLALCAMILILRSGTDLVLGLIGGKALMDCITVLNLGHLIAFVSILASTRLLVVGDKKESYNDPKKVQRRLQFVGVGAIIALAAMAIPYFDQFSQLPIASVYCLAFAFLLLVIWKLSAHL